MPFAAEVEKKAVSVPVTRRARCRWQRPIGVLGLEVVGAMRARRVVSGTVAIIIEVAKVSRGREGTRRPLASAPTEQRPTGATHRGCANTR